jgi:hypothetical protein
MNAWPPAFVRPLPRNRPDRRRAPGPFGNGALSHGLADALRRAGHDDRLAGEAVLEDHAGTASLAANFS